MAAAEEPKVQEVTEEEAAALEQEEEVAGEENGGDDEEDEGMPGMSRANRNEKKARKAVQKLGLKSVPGVNRVAIKKKTGEVFAIASPDVMRAPNSDTFIVFGEATMDDSAARAQQLAAQQFGPDGAMNMEKIQELQKQMEALQAQSKAAAGGAEGGEAAAAAEAGEADAEGDDGEVDMSGLDEKDVSLVMEQGKVSKAKAAKVLKANDGDVVNAIMELTM
ncbi:Nascent polypeptide-associated complex subunit alpha [Hondaea fermentalgiana]|uniref:Nascent polypeptide-associated complex subunit alpha n=1 Tax=Hondaea fermentalgiana TaxID=2315210 RepID=A0A2R5G537_9STRA|nr:Nascent polypeptide-associated complex subunit alpha [Hondaea fermentalgiana]|eukprot:GBG24898.1 Nascent polypeptide-associated complex subunit alpha [Hondaea fermentalgiana]